MVRTTALWNRNFFEREFDTDFDGIPKSFLAESFVTGHLVCLNLTFTEQTDVPGPGRWERETKFVSAWQELVGDRIISGAGYILLWEFSNLEHLLSCLVSATGSVAQEHCVEIESLRIGVAPVSSNIQAAYGLANVRCEKAEELELIYLPECLE
ncbi:MAG: hypothetical protein P1V97_29530, partial [Planctomycetota bacterium]|nr:hypothetical protein [Planctomycetota bacterium]